MRESITHAQAPAGENGVVYNGRPKRAVPSERRKSGQLQAEAPLLLLDAIKGAIYNSRR